MWERVSRVLAEAVARLGLVLAADLPGLVAMCIAIVGTVIVALGVRAVLRAVLTRTGFDRRAREWGVVTGVELEPGREPSRVIAGGAYWLVLTAGFALALEVLGASVSPFGISLLAYLPRLVVGIVILLVGIGVARFLERNVLIGGVNLRLRHTRLFASCTKWMAIALASAMALEQVGIGGQLPAIGFAIVVGGAALAFALAFGLGAREAVARAIERLSHRDANGGAEADKDEDNIQHL